MMVHGGKMTDIDNQLLINLDSLCRKSRIIRAI